CRGAQGRSVPAHRCLDGCVGQPIPVARLARCRPQCGQALGQADTEGASSGASVSSGPARSPSERQGAGQARLNRRVCCVAHRADATGVAALSDFDRAVRYDGPPPLATASGATFPGLESSTMFTPIPRATKIVATLGPSSSEPAILERMLVAGVNVVRVNFSH